jgi:AhpD family alkylhydroperoxidase
MRLNTYAADREGYERLLAWNDHLAAGPISPALRALVDSRASQINGCAFCLAMHSDEARQAGVPQVKLDTLAAWRDVDAFDDRERAALALTEAMTRLADRGQVDDVTWSAAREQFDDAELATLIEVIALINAFNRLNVTTQRTAEDYEAYARFRARQQERAASKA